jgi:thiazole synthase ThiGH ThiG subunit
MEDVFRIADRTFRSRLMIGTGKYRSFPEMARCHAASGAEVELVWFPNYTDSIQALSAGQLDANSQTWSDTLAPLAAGDLVDVWLFDGLV